MNTLNKKIIGFLILLIIVAAGLWWHSRTSSKPTSISTPVQTNGAATAVVPAAPANTTPATTLPTPAASGPAATSSAIVLPLDRAAERITKKFYGTYVTPQNSPVSPERFKGYHTGLDFETFPEEQNSDVPVKAICTGPLVTKGRASGYGGYAVQSCTISGQPVTVVYGHLRQSSIAASGKTLQAGDRLGLLGTGYSSETDGERKHLHLDIHKGNAVNIKGYVQAKSELSSWIDPKQVLVL